MNLTIKDVAREANVSVATVSRILNGLDGYSEETKDKVLKIVNELGFHRNAIARGLITKSTKTIGILIPDVTRTMFAEIIHAIEDYAYKKGYSLFMCNIGSKGERTLEYIRVLAERQVDGIIVTSLDPNEEYNKLLISLNKPIIFVATKSFEYSIPYVKIDDRQAAYAAVKYLIELGHKKIAFIGGDDNHIISGLPRTLGYMQALSEFGIDVDKKIIKYGDFSYESGIKAMEELLVYINNFTSIFVASDTMALGVLSVAYKNGIKIPDQISIMGFDNIKISEMAIPPLTTMGQPLYEMGETAIKNLINMIENNTKVSNVIMEYKIMERNSIRRLI